MLQQIDNIIYNIVYHNMLSNDLFNEFNNIINELNDDNNTNEDLKNKAIKLNVFLRKCSIKPLDTYLEPNNLIIEKIQQIITNDDIFKNNIQLNQDDGNNNAYKVIIRYIIQNDTTDIDKDKLYDIEPITDDEMSQFISTFNNMINQKSLMSILSFIFNNNFIGCYSKLFDDKFSQFDIPSIIYKQLNNQDVQNNVNTQKYKDIYSTLLTYIKGNNDNDFVNYFKQNISNIDIQNGHIKNVFVNKKINVDKDIFKGDKLTVEEFLKNIQNLDIITNEQFTNWNKILTDTLISLTQSQDDIKGSIEEIKKTLNNQKVTVVIDKDEKKLVTKEILVKDIFRLFCTNLKTLNGHDNTEGTKDNLSIGEHIVNELQELFNQNIKNFKVQINNKDNSFFKNFKLLLSDDDKEILSFFNIFKVTDGNIKIFDIYKEILDYVSNYKPFEELSIFYSLLYFIKKIKLESMMFYRNSDIYLFEDEQQNDENLIDKATKYIEQNMGTKATLKDLADSLYKNNNEEVQEETVKNKSNEGTDENSLGMPSKLEIKKVSVAVQKVENN